MKMRRRTTKKKKKTKNPQARATQQAGQMTVPHRQAAHPEAVARAVRGERAPSPFRAAVVPEQDSLREASQE
jgi:hypothetical protein